MKKDNIIDRTRDRVNSIVFDSNVFTYTKATNPEAFKNESYKLGGGNFLVALGIFSSLGFIAKVYVTLIDKTVKNRDGTINETDAIWSLINDMPDNISLGLPKNKQFVAEQWQQIRHALVHMSYPKLTIVSWGGGKDLNYEQIIQKIQTSKKKPFFKLGVRIELLANYLYKIIDWMEAEFSEGNYGINSVRKAEDWINESLYITKEESKTREEFKKDLED
jgi:hypothetical protein